MDEGISIERSDAELLGQCGRGDEGAWSELVGRYLGLIYATARGEGLDGEAAEEVVQIVLATLVPRVGSIRDPEALPKWLQVTTRRAAWRERRRRRAVGGGGGAGGVDAVERVADSRGGGGDGEAGCTAEQRAAMVAHLARIGERCQRLLMAIFSEPGAPDYRRISGELGMPIGSIGPTRARCLKKMMESLGSDPAARAVFPDEFEGG
ncbi:MAG: RNA polymerase sigma factor [Phycisphaerales bacterium]